jgi:hypothetical protein
MQDDADAVSTILSSPGVYAGVGSRSTPGDVLDLMHEAAARLSDRGWVCRSGSAAGADTAFEAGARSTGRQGCVEIFLPWASYRSSTPGAPSDTDGVFVASRLPTHAAAQQIASECHPVWGRITQAARLLHTRNVMQVLGGDLESPASIVIAWAPNPKLAEGGGPPWCIDAQGGTGQAIRIAARRGIPVLNIADDRHCEWLSSALGIGGSPSLRAPLQMSMFA